MSEKIKSRRARKEDVKEMVSVINKAYESEKVKKEGVPRTDEKEIEETMKREDSFFIVLTTSEDKIVGSIFVKDLDDSNAYFGMLSVHPAFRRRGLGSRLQNEANNWALKQKKKYMTCWVIDMNHDLRRRYHRQGFRPTGKKHEWSAKDRPKLREECSDSKFLELSLPLTGSETRSKEEPKK
jgi:L-amino acid N-acyltransferase YncA